MILGIGSVNVDYIIHNKRMPVEGETIYGKSVTVMGGGKEANQIAAASRLGAETTLLSAIGALDHYNNTVLDDLHWAGVNTDYIAAIPDEYSGSGYILVVEEGKNSIIIIEGANAHITPAFVEKHRHLFQKAKLCMVEFMIPMETCQYAMELARKEGVTTLCNPAPSRAIADDFYPLVDIITPNEVEAADICGFPVKDAASASNAANFFHDKGVKNVVITMGGQGAYVSDGKRRELLPCYDVKVLDTSGAGDSFNGGLAYALCRGYDLFTAARFANAVASTSVQRVGTMQSMPTLEEAQQLYRLP